ncbi:MAG: bifunctional DNA-formamidopyrimidine glycosylase/DNA-(apurinic or apyrimidinic site) lyase [Firmicutes bacterium]|nr:bifunctional DNA-formamidopyrimidine glycosylase/DNA-(apurinic or apyrimidinic site) lyase [Bacillota bacterium]
MPELPEVQTVVADLEPHLIGRRVESVTVDDPLLVRFPQQAEFCRRLEGKEILTVTRRGKYIVIGLEQQLTWMIHLRMTGRLLLNLAKEEKYLRAWFRLDDGTTVWYCDLRRFGDMWAWYPGEETQLGGFIDLGPEPLADDFCSTWLLGRAANRRAPVKTLLLDQRVVAGLGNIYVDEALFLAGIDPRRPASSISAAEAETLCLTIREVLSGAISARGTTFRDYRSGRGTSGEYQQKLNVYGRSGEPCRECGARLASVRIGGRSSVYCPRCQT